MNSDMVKPEKFGHLHLVYHFTIPLSNVNNSTCFIWPVKNLALLMLKWMGGFLKKKHKRLGLSCLLNGWASYITFKKIGALIFSKKFNSSEVLFITINLTLGFAWNTVVMSRIVLLPCCYYDLFDKLQQKGM